jgi:hypothetical protein
LLHRNAATRKMLCFLDLSESRLQEAAGKRSESQNELTPELTPIDATAQEVICRRVVSACVVTRAR